MQVEMANLICPLCKRELSAGTLNTRLCEECRALVQTASHPASIGTAGSSRSLKAQLGTASSVPDIASAHLDVESNEISESHSASNRVSEVNPEHSELIDTKDEFVLPDDHEFFDSTPYITEANLPEPAAEGSVPITEDEVIEDALQTLVAEPDSGALSNSNQSNYLSADIETQGTTVPAEDESPMLSTTPEKVSADPWEDALPASEFSRNEWPVLIGPPRDGFIARFKTQIVVTVVLALLGGAYYLIYRQTAAKPVIDSPGPLLPSKVVEPSTSAKPSSDSAESKAPSSSADSTENAESKAALQAKDKPVATFESDNAQGKFALQVAAYPNRAAAAELADKLKAAGVASYVVNVELPHRGTWYRVRVGRFNTAAEAQKFAAEAQLRARAAGMSLELIVSPYEQP
jgi:cell division septation protein DedD